MLSKYRYIGWTRGNTVQFIVVATLARHIMRISGSKPRPFTYGPYTLVPEAKRRNPCIIVGSFEDGEIDALVRAGVEAIALVKVFDAKYRAITARKRIRSLTLYPVPKKSSGGLEYLVALSEYFKISDEEVEFFQAMLSRKDALAKVLAVLDVWLRAYDLFTTFELIDDPTPEEVDRVVEYLKRVYGYEEKYRTMAEELRSRVILDRGNVLAFYLGEDDPKKYMVVANEMYSGRKALILASTVPKANVYKLLVLCNKPCGEAKRRIAETSGAECRGGSKRFTVRVSAERDLRSILEAIIRALA